MDNHVGAGMTYDLDWQFNDRVATEHFGSQKYSTSTRALRELLANFLHAVTCPRFLYQGLCEYGLGNG
jgi:hypothetical protein